MLFFVVVAVNLCNLTECGETGKCNDGNYTGITHNCTALQLEFNNNKVDLSSLENFRGVENLQMRGNDITELQPYVFSGLKFATLDLSFNKIQILRKNVFVDLTELNLSNNHIEYIERNTFVNITRIDLANNMLCRLDPYTFVKSPGLRALNLANNSLEYLQLNLKTLYSLNLNRNFLREFTSEARIELLDLSENYIEELNINLKALKLLNITYNKMKFQFNDSRIEEDCSNCAEQRVNLCANPRRRQATYLFGGLIVIVIICICIYNRKRRNYIEDGESRMVLLTREEPNKTI